MREEESNNETPTCGPGCGCNDKPNKGSFSRSRWMVFAVIMVIAVAMVVRAASKEDTGPAQTPDNTVSNSQERIPCDSSVSGTLADATNPEKKRSACGEMIQSLGDLTTMAIDKDGVFIFVSGKDDVQNSQSVKIIEKAVAAIREQGVALGMFTMEEGAAEYANIARQVPPPGVIAIAKGRGTSVVSGDITNDKLMQAFVRAMNAGGGCCSSKRKK